MSFTNGLTNSIYLNITSVFISINSGPVYPLVKNIKFWVS